MLTFSHIPPVLYKAEPFFFPCFTNMQLEDHAQQCVKSVLGNYASGNALWKGAMLCFHLGFSYKSVKGNHIQVPVCLGLHARSWTHYSPSPHISLAVLQLPYPPSMADSPRGTKYHCCRAAPWFLGFSFSWTSYLHAWMFMFSSSPKGTCIFLFQGLKCSEL